MNVNYIRITKGLNDPGTLIKPEDLSKHVSTDTDYYSSLYFYNDAHYARFQETKSVQGIRDVLSNKLVLDFDSVTDLEQARMDAVEAVKRLQDLGSDPNDVEIYFSGKKGFTVHTTLDKMLNPDKLANLAINIIGKDLVTLDKTIYNASRIIRVPNTRHQETGLFKTQLKAGQLVNLSIDAIKKLAQTPGTTRPSVKVLHVPEEAVKEEPKKVKRMTDNEIDWSSKPKQWRNCKWSIAQGNFKNGERHQALMILASTCRGMGFTKEMTYDICKGALRRSTDTHGQGTTTKEELFNNIIEESVFTDNWSGGQYTCQKPGWLQTYCQSLGNHKCEAHDDEERKPCVQFDDMAGHFARYSQNFEKNVIKMGIPGLDENILLTTSTLNGLLGNPGSGKTTLAINYLRNTSLQGIPSIFLSLDMGMPIVFAKLIQKKTGQPFKEVMNMFKTDPVKSASLVQEIKDEYKNVGFNFRAGLTVADIKDIIKSHEKDIGQKVKLVVIDYLECLASPYGSDQTASTGFLANQLKDLANETETCVLLLLQTQKYSTPDISDPLLSLKGVKGSSLIEQSCSTILTLWREGYSPKHVEDDSYISFAVVKNRFGSLWSDDFFWNGVKGLIRGLSPEERSNLKDFRQKKKDEKNEKDGSKTNTGWD